MSPLSLSQTYSQFIWKTSKAVRENKQAFLAKNHGSNYLQIKLGNIDFNESIVVEYIYLVSLKCSRLFKFYQKDADWKYF